MPNKFVRPKGNKIWELITDEEGPLYFSFDKKKIYNFWTDYWDLTDDERKIFDKEYPVMASLKNPDIDRNSIPPHGKIELEYSN